MTLKSIVPLKYLAAILFLIGNCMAFAQNSTDSESVNGSIAPQGTAGSSVENYQADLFTGRFSYSLPIKVAPGRHGSAPNISIRYNSANSSGLCGVGWTIDNAYIQRNTKTGVPIAWKGTNYAAQGTPTQHYELPTPSYDDTKGFVSSFEGVMGTLILVGPTNANPLVYRQQIDKEFLTYEYYTNNYWQVIDKNGTVFFFGEGQTNQMENPKANWPQGVGSSTFRWTLDRVVDVDGNETFLQYAIDGGMLYLTNIIYDANSNSPALAATDQVSFILTSRPDTNITFISGYRVTSRQLLSEIDVRAGGANVRKYVLNYMQSPSTLRSLLASVTEFGTDYVTSLPPITFNYQIKPFTFGPDTNWLGVSSQGQTSSSWNTIRNSDVNENNYVNLMDIDGDGLPDRVMRVSGSTYTNLVAQRNTGTGFESTNEIWFPIDTRGNNSSSAWGSPIAVNLLSGPYGVTATTYISLMDLNGDGYPDRVIGSPNNSQTNFWVQYGTGASTTRSFSNSVPFGFVQSASAIMLSQTDPFGNTCQFFQFVDMNGDGFPDIVTGSQVSGLLTNWLVQVNSSGSQFGTTNMWMGVQDLGQGANGYGDTYSWASTSAEDTSGYMYITLADINGDGLPDRIMRRPNSPYTNFVVQFNNGSGFEPPEKWESLNNQGVSGTEFASPMSGVSTVESSLVDMTGDGLLDRVMRVANAPYTNWVVQLNTGSGFAPPVNWGPINSQGETSAAWNDLSANGGDTYVDLMDINGDGLPDRVMRATNAPYDHFVVQLNQGPFPDLLNVISNGIGGSVQVSYAASTTLNNRSKDWINDPWAEGAVSLLPFNVWVVSQIVTSDGMGNNSTNSYAFNGGYYNAQQKEFRGFSQCTQTDPLGTQTITYFHQSGGRDNSAIGEYLDQASESKKGIPFRIDLIGTNGLTNRITLNKVEEVELNSNGWYFPFVAQTIVMNYEGLGSYRATAVQYSYDTNTENLISEADLGEVGSVIFNGQTFTQVGSNSVFKWIAYTNIDNILNRPMDIKITSDGAGANRLSEIINTYDGNGNLKTSQSWLDITSAFITTVSNDYDQYGNLTQSTDPAGITMTIAYDAAYEQFPVSQTVGSFTSYSLFDKCSGELLASTNIEGLVCSNSYDVFFRPTATYISTNANGPPVLWQTKMTYILGGVSGGNSYNCTISQANNAVDPANGFVTYTYADGVGRTIETREESETANQYRIANTVYDLCGHPFFATLPYFGSGTNYTALNTTYLGSLTVYDSIGRACQSIPAVNGAFSSGTLTGVTTTGGDSGSPVGPTTTAFLDGNNPWATVTTDANGKVTKSYRDAFGRTLTNTQVTASGNVNTAYAYDLLGNLTNTTDNAGNSTKATFDSLGRKTSMVDPDMGTWTYAYDNANRLVQQTDAKNNVIQFNYSNSDPLGRLTSKQIYNPAGGLTGTITYLYDSSGDPNHTVYPGQLYQVTDLQGYERFSYDVRGRTLKDTRFLNVNAMEYTTQATYDDADRIQQLIYPGGVATLQYSYDTAGHLSQVKSISGTATNEVFYTPGSFNALDQLTGCSYGNGVATTYSYYANSARLQNITSGVTGTGYQNLTYKYDNCSDITNVNDGVYSGAASGTVTNIAYDDLYRVTSISSAARSTKIYGYNSIGNLLTNQDFGPSTYQYGAQPHMVTSANGTNYSYDACGNMISRGNQALAYDAQNQLIRVTSTNDSVAFGYDDTGERLWRSGTNGYTIWVGGIYEINNGKVLCHVIVGGQLIATFEPECTAGLAKIFGEKNWSAASTGITSVLSWPCKHGRGHWTLFAGAWLAVMGLCLVGVREKRLKRYEWRGALRFHSLWKQVVTLASISAMLWAGTGNVDASPAYNPVFYFYCTDYLGSSNVLTDNSGNLVQHYEYSTFGQASYQNNTSAFPVSNRYTGQTADDETGLMYYGGRYYDPQLARFIQPDPTIPDPTDSQSFNRYSYCRNNPLNEIDPSGFDDVVGAGGDSLGNYGNLADGYWNDSVYYMTYYEVSPFSNFGAINFENSNFDSSSLTVTFFSSYNTHSQTSGSSPPNLPTSINALLWQNVYENIGQNVLDYNGGYRRAAWGMFQSSVRNTLNPLQAGFDFARSALTISQDPLGFASNAYHDVVANLETSRGIGGLIFNIHFGMITGGEGSLAKAPAEAVEGTLTKAERLSMVYERVTTAPRATTAQEAMQQMHSTLDAVEDAYSGVPKNPNPGLTPDGRMYPVQADRLVTAEDGTITATSRGHVTTYGPNGSITVTDRATGAVVYHKP